MTYDMHNAWIDWWIKLVKYLQSSTAAYISTELENRNSIFDLWSIVHGCNLKGNVLRGSKTRVFARRRDLSAIEFDCRNRIMDHPWWVAVPITHRVDWYSTSVFIPANPGFTIFKVHTRISICEKKRQMIQSGLFYQTVLTALELLDIWNSCLSDSELC